MYMGQESNTKLTSTREKLFTQASVLTIRPPCRYKSIKLMKYDWLGGFTCTLFPFWESQCGGELGQLTFSDRITCVRVVCKSTKNRVAGKSWGIFTKCNLRM